MIPLGLHPVLLVLVIGIFLLILSRARPTPPWRPSAMADSTLAWLARAWRRLRGRSVGRDQDPVEDVHRLR